MEHTPRMTTGRFIALMLAVLLLSSFLRVEPARSMEVVGSLNVPDREGVVIRDTIAYTVGQTDFTAISIARPASPSVLGNLALGMVMEAVDVEGNYAYCAGGAAGFAVVNISNPRAPSYVRTIILTGQCLDIAVDDTILVVAIGTAVVICGIQNPASPHVLATYNHATTSVALDWSMRRVWAGGSNGVIELNISNPRQPTRNSHYGAGLPASPIAFSPPHIDAARSTSLLTLNVNPLSQAGTFGASLAIQAVCEGGGYQTMIGLANGDVLHIDETDMPPSFVASANVGTQIRRMDTETIDMEAYIAVATVSGLMLIRYTQVTAAEPLPPQLVPGNFEVSAYPNPFNSSARLQFSHVKTGWHTLEIFNVVGRK
ncbi:hypothetical protein KKB28_00885, partial [bacterium]|nr:hypothetical protein [bacterium]